MLSSDAMFKALLGPAGVGKSYQLQQELEKEPKFAYLAASTGIAAVNIGGTTIHSLLGYFGTEELLYKASDGSLIEALDKVRKKFKHLCIDEISILPGEQLDIICYGIEKLNQKYPRKPLKLLVTGDAGQLPPVKGRPFFHCKYWPRFEVISLSEIKRQSNREFIQALQLVRAGEAEKAVDWFDQNVGFNQRLDNNFQGSTFLATNKAVDSFNAKAMAKLNTKEVKYPKKIIGRNRSEWNNIPAAVTIKKGCLVVMLKNCIAEGYANGDLATVKEALTNQVLVEIRRTGQEVLVEYQAIENQPIGSNKVIGRLNYLPLKVAYGTTIHKAQGLSIGAGQFRFTDPFIRKLNGGLYTALSRVATPEGLRLVGSKDSFIKACHLAPEYQEFISSKSIKAA